MVNEKLTHGNCYLGSRSNKNKTFYIYIQLFTWRQHLDPLVKYWNNVYVNVWWSVWPDNHDLQHWKHLAPPYEGMYQNMSPKTLSKYLFIMVSSLIISRNWKGDDGPVLFYTLIYVLVFPYTKFPKYPCRILPGTIINNSRSIICILVPTIIQL